MNNKTRFLIVTNNGYVPKLNSLLTQLTTKQKKELKNKVTKLITTKQGNIKDIIANLFSCGDWKELKETIDYDLPEEVEKISKEEDYLITFTDNINKCLTIYENDLEDNIKKQDGIWIRELNIKTNKENNVKVNR